MSQLENISAAFVSARRAGRALPEFPGTVPTTLEDAYAVQHASIRAWGEPIAGFKVGGVAPDFADRFPAHRLAGPVFEHLVQTVTDGGTVDVPVFKGGFAAYEAEYVMRLGGLDRLDGPVTTLEEAAGYVTALHIGAEIASSPLFTLNALGPGSIISDFGNQAGVVIGPEVDLSMLMRLPEIEVVTVIDGAEIGRATAAPAKGGPLDALQFLLNHIQTLPDDIALPDSPLLSSGAITGVHASGPGTTSTITFGQLGQFTINMTAIAATNHETPTT